MNWKEIYRNKRVSAEDAVSKIKSNSRVIIGHAVGEPTALVMQWLLIKIIMKM